MPAIQPYLSWTRLLLVVLLSAQMPVYARADADDSADADIDAENVTPSDRPFDFAHQVVPILKEHCFECHGGEHAEGGFSFNTRALVLEAGVVEPGRPNQSRLIELVSSSDPDDQMPPKDRERVSEQDVATLRQWIVLELPWEEGFTFAGVTYEPPLRPRRPELPPAVDGRTNPVDRILDAYLASHQLPRPKPLDDAQFMRRLYFDVIGLPPPADELSAFVADASPDKRSALIREVLNRNDAYAAHWLTFWNDLLRNAYAGTGYIDGGRQQITGWLYRSLVENKPFDDFVRELIAPVPEAEGFVSGIKWRGNVNASQQRAVQFAQNVTQIFLGINMKCASCHDSFIDRWTLEETYGLAAVYATKPLELHRCDVPLGKTAKAAWIFPELGQVDSAAPQLARLEQTAALLTHPQNGRLARTIVNRLWHRLMGRGIVHPVDAMHTEPWNADLLDWLAVYLADRSYDLKDVIEVIVGSAAYQSQAVVLDEAPAEDYVYTGPIAKRMTAEQFLDAIWSITNTWPEPELYAFRVDGRRQFGHLAAILQALGEVPNAAQSEASTDGLDLAAWQSMWGNRPMRAAFTPLDPLQASLGRPNREQVVTSRPTELTTLEAITLTNGPSLAQIIQRGAAHILKCRHTTTEELIDWLFVAALAREPTPGERRISQQLLGDHPTSENVEDFVWAVLMLPDFQIIR